MPILKELAALVLNLVLSAASFCLRRLMAKSQRKVRIMSSRHTLYRLGYPYDTMAFTISSKVLFLS
jgi:hypothetical protein